MPPFPTAGAGPLHSKRLRAFTCMVVGRPLFPDCRLHTVFILPVALQAQCPFEQETTFQSQMRGIRRSLRPCCLCCDLCCSRAHCAQFWRQLQLRFLALLAREISDRMRRKVGSVFDIPRQRVSMPTSLLHATNFNKTGGV